MSFCVSLSGLTPLLLVGNSTTAPWRTLWLSRAACLLVAADSLRPVFVLCARGAPDDGDGSPNNNDSPANYWLLAWESAFALAVVTDVAALTLRRPHASCRRRPPPPAPAAVARDHRRRSDNGSQCDDTCDAHMARLHAG